MERQQVGHRQKHASMKANGQPVQFLTSLATKYLVGWECAAILTEDAFCHCTIRSCCEWSQSNLLCRHKQCRVRWGRVSEINFEIQRESHVRHPLGTPLALMGQQRQSWESSLKLFLAYWIRRTLLQSLVTHRTARTARRGLRGGSLTRTCLRLAAHQHRRHLTANHTHWPRQPNNRQTLKRPVNPSRMGGDADSLHSLTPRGLPNPTWLRFNISSALDLGSRYLRFVGAAANESEAIPECERALEPEGRCDSPSDCCVGGNFISGISARVARGTRVERMILTSMQVRLALWTRILF
jgi:hypothetical protein